MAPEAADNDSAPAAMNASAARTLTVAFVVSFCCAVLVAGTAIVLRPLYEQNQEVNRQRNVLDAAGLPTSAPDAERLFEGVETRVVDLETGDYAPDVDAAAILGAGPGARAGTPVPEGEDIALIGERPRYAVVYLVREGDALETIVLPVYGYGLWSTMYGYLALEGDADTVVGLRFYEHGETPGLGAEIDDPEWLAGWRGKRTYGESGEPLIEVVKGRVAPGSAGAEHRVDGITGATITGQGVTNLLRYWLGDQGFGPYLQRMREGAQAP